MFENYENIPTSYSPNNIKNYAPNTHIKKKPLEDFDAFGNLIGYSWYYGDQVVLEFFIDGEVIFDDGHVEEANVFLEGKKINLKFLDFRYEVVFSETLEASADNKFLISPANSLTMPAGPYRGKLTLIDDTDEENIKEYVLMPVDRWIFSVKS